MVCWGEVVLDLGDQVGEVGETGCGAQGELEKGWDS